MHRGEGEEGARNIARLALVSEIRVSLDTFLGAPTRFNISCRVYARIMGLKHV